MRQPSRLQAFPLAAPDAALAAEAARLLTTGGDERITLDPATGRNRYGCAPEPLRSAAEFSSSTASSVSGPAFEAACRRLDAFLSAPSPVQAYRAGAQAVRERLAQLCGAPHGAGRIVLGASGTDLHLFAADLARGMRPSPLATVVADPRESGRGAPNALRSLRYSSASPHGAPAQDGAPLPGCPTGALIAVPVREAEGDPRPAEAIDSEFERACASAIARGGAVLLVMLDVSKTGLTVPSAACAARLKRRFGAQLTVLVDACQFRISAATLSRYLDEGFLVAVTGSKFLGGPAFSGALLLPAGAAKILATGPLSPALGDYSARADWPEAFVGRSVLPEVANPGLLLRWEAALHELERFRRVPDAAVVRIVAKAAAAVADRLAHDAAFEPAPPPPAMRFEDGGWDSLPTIFPFLVRRDGAALAAPETQALYEALRDRHGVFLGQPVPIGAREGRPVSVLRLSVSARQIVEAATGLGGEALLIRRAMDALDAVTRQVGALEPA